MQPSTLVKFILKRLAVLNTLKSKNAELLQIRGRVYMKYYSTAALYPQYDHQGLLSQSRQEFLSNQKIYELGKSAGLQTLINPEDPEVVLAEEMIVPKMYFNPISSTSWSSEQKEQLIQIYQDHNLIKLEKAFGLKFSDRLVLVKSLTHSSAPHANFTGHNKALACFGDALLDHVLLKYLMVRIQNELSSYQLSLTLTKLSKNESLGQIAIDSGLSKYMIQGSSSLKEKVHGDLLESFAAALFINCKMNETKFWNQFYRIFGQFIDRKIDELLGDL